MDLILTCIAAVIIAIGLTVIIWRKKKFINEYQGKCVLITGTDTGIGRALALALDKKEIKVYAGCYTEDGLKSLQEETSNKMKFFKLDITDEKSLIAAREYIETDLAISNQSLWGLVNNAGIATGFLFHLTTLDDYNACMNVNFFGTIRTTEIFMPLIKSSQGRIVNMLSILRRCPTLVEPYTCSKVALTVYNDGLRRCLKDYGIHVAAIEPGSFRTNMTSDNLINNDLDRTWIKLPDHLKIEYGEKFLEIAKQNYAHMARMPFARYRFSHIDAATDAITHALFAKYPNSNYICGKDAKFLLRFEMYLPTFLSDFLARLGISHVIRALQVNLKNRQNTKDFHPIIISSNNK